MRIHALAAHRPGERRTPVTPTSVRRLVEAGHEVTFEPSVGVGAGHEDPELIAAGATAGVAAEPDLVVCVEPPVAAHLGGARAVLGLLEPLDHPDHIEKLAATGAALLAFELVPRNTRAQAVDALSSQATLVGYQAILVGASLCDRAFPMYTTAAGTIRPARVLVLGAGVAGLQAIATARRLGAVVSAFDVRAAASEQVESLGAVFISLEAETQDATRSGGYARESTADVAQTIVAGLHEHVVRSDVVVTAAAIPGRPAPVLVTEATVEEMRPGSVVIDCSAATGGNCEVTRPGETIVVSGVTVSGPLDLASRTPNHASQLYSRNVANFVEMLTGDRGGLSVDLGDDVVAGSLAADQGVVIHPSVLEALGRAV